MFWTPDHSTQRVALEVSSLSVWLWACPDKCPMIFLTLSFWGNVTPIKGEKCVEHWAVFPRCCHFGTCEGKNGFQAAMGSVLTRVTVSNTAAPVSLSQQHLLRSPRKTPALVTHTSAVTIPPLTHPAPIACSQMVLAGNYKMCSCCGQDWASWPSM